MNLFNPQLPENKLAGEIINAAFEVHKNLGPGLLESAYAHCLCTELTARNFDVAREVWLPVMYKGKDIGVNYRIDILVNQLVIIEVKAVDVFSSVHMAQLLTYMKLSNIKLGLLINFKSELLKNGIRRVVNNL